MTVPRISRTTGPSVGHGNVNCCVPGGEGYVGHGVLGAARSYLGNRWALLVLAGLAVIIGLSFGGWGWLVAAGLAPIILSTLPCLVMCGFGVCMMCRSNKSQSVASRDAAGLPPSAAADRSDIAAPAAADGSANALAENAAAEGKEKTHA